MPKTPEWDKLVVGIDQPYDVYIGRGVCPVTQKPGEWGNDWSHIVESNAAHYVTGGPLESIACHREYVLSKPELVARIKAELKGKTLGCWCRRGRHKTRICHGQTLAEIANTTLGDSLPSVLSS